MAMTVAVQTGIPPFLMAIMVANGANSASLSPIGPTGIIVNGLMDRMGLPAVPWQNYFIVFAAHMTVAFAGYLVFGGWRFFRAENLKRKQDPLYGKGTMPYTDVPDGDVPDAARPLQWRHWLTLGVIVMLITGVIFFGLHVGMGALAGAVVLVLAGATDESQAIRSMPWGPILMVSGVTVLIALIEKTGGIDLFSAILASMSSAQSVTGVVALIAGSISIFSSTSGVVLPAFLPMVPQLSERLGGAGPLEIAWSINVGASLVDLSALSTVGALYIAGAAPGSDVRRLFNGLLAWGLSMAFVGAVLCWVLFG
jgi:di/tricarboxylate transporter